jgi:hypothetical protein
MVLGPAARNIDGHRVATARAAAAVAAGLQEGHLLDQDHADPADRDSSGLDLGSLMPAVADD